MESTTLVAPDISCENCQRAIEGAVGSLAGVSRAMGRKTPPGEGALNSVKQA